MDKTLIQKLRRFALSIGLIFLTYSMAEIKLVTPVQINPLGIPLVIKSAAYIGIALLGVSVYVSFRYLYYAILIGPAPHTIRKRLKKSILPDGIKFDIKLASADYYRDFRGRLHAAINESFPRVGDVEAKLIDFSYTASAEEADVKIEVPTVVKLLCILENIDYYLPICINVIAIIVFIYD